MFQGRVGKRFPPQPSNQQIQRSCRILQEIMNILQGGQILETIALQFLGRLWRRSSWKSAQSRWKKRRHLGKKWAWKKMSQVQGAPDLIVLHNEQTGSKHKSSGCPSSTSETLLMWSSMLLFYNPIMERSSTKAFCQKKNLGFLQKHLSPKHEAKYLQCTGRNWQRSIICWWLCTLRDTVKKEICCRNTEMFLSRLFYFQTWIKVR